METIMKYEEQIKTLADMTAVVASKNANALFVWGPGGVGKTHVVTEVLVREGVRYIHYKGHTSNAAMYNSLYKNRKGLIVFDDCDSVFKDPVSLNILKSVLDSYEKRIVRWGTTSTAVDVAQFEFTGQVIFISNMSKTKIHTHMEALMTRCIAVDMTMERGELLRYIRVVARDTEYKGIPRGKRLEMFRYLKKHQEQVKSLNVRSLLQMFDIYRYEPKGWRTRVRNLWKTQSQVISE